MHAVIKFYAENISYRLKNKRILSSWIKEIIQREKKIPNTITFVLCDDEYLHKMNVSYLNHDTLTDIITFDYSENDIISGDMFISIDRVRENAVIFKKSFEDELFRVMCHGVLHLMGYKDKKASEMTAMRAKEDECLLLLNN